MPNDNWIAEISGIMERFVTQGLSISTKRLYLTPPEGGIGLFNLKIFLQSIQATWVKRAFSCCNDNWKFDLIHESEHSLEKVGIINDNLGKTLHGIAKSFRTFAEFFAKVDSNYLHIPIQNNPQFGYGNRGNCEFEDNFFSFANDENRTDSKTWEMLTENRALKSLPALKDILGVGLTREKYDLLKVGWTRATKKYQVEGKKGTKLVDFMRWDKKGSKCFRTIFTRNSGTYDGKTIKSLPQVKTFLRLTETENLEISRIKNMMGSWNYSFLPSKIRTFLFKFYNNILGLNSRVAKFNQNTDPSCTFCSINNLRPAPKESFTHLFYYCETTRKILAEFFARFFTIVTPKCAIFFLREFK